MDLRSFVSQVNASEAGSRPETYGLFTFYHPQYQPEFSPYQDDQYASFIFAHRDCLGESSGYHPSVSKFLFGSNSFPGLLTIAMLIIQSDELPDELRPKWRICTSEHNGAFRTRPVFRSTCASHPPREDVDVFRINATRRSAQVSDRVVLVLTGTNLLPFRSGPPFL